MAIKKFLDQEGLSYFWDKAKEYVDAEVKKDGEGNVINTTYVKKVNNVAPVNGNVTIAIPTVTNTYSADSTNAMSGKAVASALSTVKVATATAADTAAEATHATSADSATNATNATEATHATSADSATNATNATNDENGLNIATNYALKSEISSVYRYKGSVASSTALPTSNQVTGDVYNVEDTGANYAWTGTAWDKLSETVDLANASVLKATQDASGNVITETYIPKDDISSIAETTSKFDKVFAITNFMPTLASQVEETGMYKLFAYVSEDILGRANYTKEFIEAASDGNQNTYLPTDYDCLHNELGYFLISNTKVRLNGKIAPAYSTTTEYSNRECYLNLLYNHLEAGPLIFLTSEKLNKDTVPTMSTEALLGMAVTYFSTIWNQREDTDGTVTILGVDAASEKVISEAGLKAVVDTLATKSELETAGKVKTVNNVEPDASGNIELDYATEDYVQETIYKGNTIPVVKKTTYNGDKTITIPSTGKIKITYTTASETDPIAIYTQINSVYYDWVDKYKYINTSGITVDINNFVIEDGKYTGQLYDESVSSIIDVTDFEISSITVANNNDNTVVITDLNSLEAADAVFNKSASVKTLSELYISKEETSSISNVANATSQNDDIYAKKYARVSEILSVSNNITSEIELPEDHNNMGKTYIKIIAASSSRLNKVIYSDTDAKLLNFKNNKYYLLGNDAYIDAYGDLYATGYEFDTSTGQKTDTTININGDTPHLYVYSEDDDYVRVLFIPTRDTLETNRLVNVEDLSVALGLLPESKVLTVNNIEPDASGNIAVTTDDGDIATSLVNGLFDGETTSEDTNINVITSTVDLEAGVSDLATGTLYLVYQE